MKPNYPFDLIILGGSGDLSLRKLMPAMYRAMCEGSLPKGSLIIPTCLSKKERDNFFSTLKKSLTANLAIDEYDESCIEQFIACIKPTVLDVTKSGAAWQKLKSFFPTDHARSRLFYMAIPPAIFGVACEHLEKNGCIHEKTRIIVEKPIGYDSQTAEKINHIMSQYFDESAIFRIDHYLGKETVQNLMSLRFTNVIFEQLWDGKSIDHVQISISETVGLEQRALFYDDAGALRDMVQNHLLQLLCLVAMESPNKLNAKSIRAEKIKVLEALRPLTQEAVLKNTVRGQYVAGEFEGALVPGYLEELGKANSTTETFVAIKVHIDNWRWANVPFYLRTGKRMQKQSAEIVIHFKDVSHNVHEQLQGDIQPNQLVISLQPNESIELILMTKDLSSHETQLNPVSLNLNFSEKYKNLKSDAYKRLLLDAAAGNPALFIHRDEVAAAWQWIDPVISAWATQDLAPELYRAGTWGPKKASELIQNDGRQWFQGEDV